MDHRRVVPVVKWNGDVPPYIVMGRLEEGNGRRGSGELCG